MAVLVLRPVVYGAPTVIGLRGGKFREVIAPGALGPALEDASGVAALRDHNPSLLLGRAGSRTLRLEDGPSALRAEIDLPPTELGRETEALVRRGDLRGGSFAFVVGKDEWLQLEGDPLPTRVIREVEKLFDVSVCTFPAYSSTSCHIRARSPENLRVKRLALDLMATRAVRIDWAAGARPIPRPSWVNPRGLAWRHGCGHAGAIGWLEVGSRGACRPPAPTRT